MMWRHMVGGDELESARVMWSIDVEVSGEPAQVASSDWCGSDSKVKCLWEVICRMDALWKGNGGLVEVGADISRKTGYSRNDGNHFWRGVGAVCGIKLGVQNHEGKTCSGWKTGFQNPPDAFFTVKENHITMGGV